MNSTVIKSVMLGHAVADALGVPVEFFNRSRLIASPVTDMMGYGTYPVPAGTWSDDTSMSLCALDVLAKGECDFDQIMHRFDWWLGDGAFTATGEMFDVGNVCRQAVINYHVHKKSWRECGLRSETANGNGSLMRIHPFVLYLLAKEESLNAQNMQLIFDASALTHAHMRSKLGCAIYACVLEALIKAPSRVSVYIGLARASILYKKEEEFEHYRRIFTPGFDALPAEQIQSSGYVVHTLEAALWCLLTTDNYKSCVLKAVNLGEDTDTVAAVAGGLAGALYGYDAIPTEWLNTLKRREYIEELCERLSLLGE